jgi:hypothetical protein
VDALRRGIHIYPFQFELPQGIPPSFEAKDGLGSYGRVTYSATTHLSDSREREIVKDRKSSFLVRGHLDLNLIPIAVTPIAINRSEVLPLIGSLGTTWWWRKARVELSFKMEKSGFVPGETLLQPLRSQSD